MIVRFAGRLSLMNMGRLPNVSETSQSVTSPRSWPVSMSMMSVSVIAPVRA